jgi:hypothetical protein
VAVTEKLKIFKDKKDKYHFKTKDDSHIDIEYKDRYIKLKLHKWDKEVSIEVSLDMIKADTHTFIDNKIEIEDANKKVRVYPIDKRSTKDFYGDALDEEQVHDGGIRYEVVYLEKPLINYFDVLITCKNTRWTKQPPLTQQELDNGDMRPLNVDGSYAVYHVSKKNNQYKTGKMIHVYRPLAIDALGNKAWCEIDVEGYIDPTSMRVTIPQQFLDEAVYPVVIDPDLGYTAIGGTTETIVLNGAITRNGSAWTMPENGTVNYMRARLSGDNVVTDFKAIINQKDSGGAGTHGEVAGPVENLAVPIAAHWEEFTFAGEGLTNAVTYILNVIGKGLVKGRFFLAKDTNGAVASYDETPGTYAPIDDPWVEAAAGTTIDYSIYVNYSVGWTGKISGVVAPAAIAGVPKANIQSVKGVA